MSLLDGTAVGIGSAQSVFAPYADFTNDFSPAGWLLVGLVGCASLCVWLDSDVGHAVRAKIQDAFWSGCSWMTTRTSRTSRRVATIAHGAH